MTNPTKVLIVDDDRDLRLVLRTTLERAGYDVVEAENGREGLSLVTSYVPDIIVLDILMHEMDGREFCRHLVEEMRVRGVRILVYSAISGNSRTVRDLLAIPELQTDFLHKPSGPVEIKMRIEEMLAGRRGGPSDAPKPAAKPDDSQPPRAVSPRARPDDSQPPRAVSPRAKQEDSRPPVAEPRKPAAAQPPPPPKKPAAPQPPPSAPPKSPQPAPAGEARASLKPASPSLDNRARLKPRGATDSSPGEPPPAAKPAAPQSAPPKPAAAAPKSAPQPGKKLRILMVDDDKDILTLFKYSLRDAYEIETAENGLDGLEMMETFDPDFVVVDYNMPVMNGLEMVRLMRRHPRFRQIPALFLTANTDQALVRKAYEEGGNLFLRKPIDPPRLRKAIDLFVRESGFTAQTRAAGRAATAHPALEPQPGPAAEPPRATLRPDESSPDMRARLQPRAPGGSGPAPARAGSPRPPASGIRPRLLLVDHVEEQRKALARLIEDRLGDQTELLAAGDYQTALANLSRWEPDAILYNTKNPGLDGVGFFQMLKIKKIAPEIDFAFVTVKPTPAEEDFSRKRLGLEPVSLSNSPDRIAADVLEVIQQAASHARPKRYDIDRLLDEERREAARRREDALRTQQEQKDFQRRYMKLQEFIDKEL